MSGPVLIIISSDFCSFFVSPGVTIVDGAHCILLELNPTLRNLGNYLIANDAW